MIPAASLVLGLAGLVGFAVDADSLPGVAIDARLAAAETLVVGDTVTLRADAGSARRFIVRAIYRRVPDPANVLSSNQYVRLHLSDLATLRGAPDRIDRLGVGLRRGVSPDTAATRLNRLAFGYRAHPSAAIAAASSRTFLVVSRFHRAIAVISILASAIFLLCLMLLRVDERRLDTAVMRLVGISRRTVFATIVAEACLISVIGSGVGIGLAAAAGAITNAYYQRRFETTLTFSYLTADIVAVGVALALVLGIAAGTVAAGRLVRTDPLVLWRRHP